jgi:hypothetical protein
MGNPLDSNMFRVASAVGSTALLMLCGCDTAGAPVAEPVAPQPVATSTTVAATTTAAAPEADPGLPAYGVQPTTRHQIATGEQTCGTGSAGRQVAEVRGAQANAPIVTVAVPDGFHPAPGMAELNLTGPDGITGAVRIAPTTLAPAEAFEQYADERTAGYDINTVSVLPAELCEYSGQKLRGLLAQTPGQGIDYLDRIVHVWTDDGDFVVSVQTQAPSGTAGLDQAASLLTSDIGIRLP